MLFSVGVRNIFNSPLSHLALLLCASIIYVRKQCRKCAIYNQIEADWQRYVSTFTLSFFSAARILSYSLRPRNADFSFPSRIRRWPIPINSAIVFELRNRSCRTFFKRREIRVIYKGGIFVQKLLRSIPSTFAKRHRCTVLDGMPVFSYRTSVAAQCPPFPPVLVWKGLECPVILQYWPGVVHFFIGFIVKGQMNHDFAFANRGKSLCD